MNFATLKGLTIPEGNVTQITDASGRVLWSAAKPITITLVRASYYQTEVIHGWLEINGVTYYAAETPTEISVREGTKILCHSDYGGVSLNGTQVASSNDNINNKVNYDYMASTNATISIMNMHYSSDNYMSVIAITET